MSNTKVMVTKPGSANSHGPGVLPDPVIALARLRGHPPRDHVHEAEAEIERDLAEPGRDRQQHRRQRRIDEFEQAGRIAADRGSARAAPAARPSTRADNPWSCRCPRFPAPARIAVSTMQQNRNSTSSGARSDGYLNTRSPIAMKSQRRPALRPGSHRRSKSAERAAHQRTADGAAERAADRLADDRRRARRPPCW